MSRYRNLRNPERFAATDVLCVFIGHVKSGGSLLGAMLDAHPDALVSDEVGVLKYLEAGFSREQIFHLIEKGSRREAVKDSDSEKGSLLLVRNERGSRFVVVRGPAE